MMFYDWLYLYYSRLSVKINHFQSFLITKNHVIILCRMYKIKKASPPLVGKLTPKAADEGAALSLQPFVGNSGKLAPHPACGHLPPREKPF